MKPVDRIVLDVESAADPALYGWGNLHKVGIGVACVYSYISDSYTFYDHTEAGRQSLIARIMQAEQVFGFMIAAFDLPVIFRVQRTQLWTGPIGEAVRTKVFDLWRLIAAGMNRSCDSVPPKGYSLDPIAKATLGAQAGAGKTMDAAKAPELFQAGDAASIMKLCGYVLEDVRLERDLVNFALRHGYLIAGGGSIAKIGVDPWHRAEAPKNRTFIRSNAANVLPHEVGSLRPSARVAEALGLPDVAVGDGVQVREGAGNNPYAIPPSIDLGDGSNIIEDAWTDNGTNIDPDLMLRIGEEIDKLPPPEFDPAAVAYANARQAARDAGRDADLVDPAICMNHGATFIEAGVPACGCSAEEVQNMATGTTD